jgi:hypothetical protein
VKVATLSPHTTNIFHGLDPSLFGILKKQTNDKLPFGSVDSVAPFIKRILHKVKQTHVQDDSRRALTHIDIQYGIDVEPYLVVLDEFALHKNPGFLAIWQRDHLFE